MSLSGARTADATAITTTTPASTPQAMPQAMPQAARPDAYCVRELRDALPMGPKAARTKAVYKRAVERMDRAARAKALRARRAPGYARLYGAELQSFLAHMERAQDWLDSIPASEMSDEDKYYHFTRLAKRGLHSDDYDLAAYASLATVDSNDADFFNGLDLIFDVFNIYELEDMLYYFERPAEENMETAKEVRVREAIVEVVKEIIDDVKHENAYEEMHKRAKAAEKMRAFRASDEESSRRMRENLEFAGAWNANLKRFMATRTAKTE